MRNVTKDNITDVFKGYMADDMAPPDMMPDVTPDMGGDMGPCSLSLNTINGVSASSVRSGLRPCSVTAPRSITTKASPSS